jgi:hypothetical protein
MENAAMNAERWQNVERLYHATLEREESQRARLAGVWSLVVYTDEHEVGWRLPMEPRAEDGGL